MSDADARNGVDALAVQVVRTMVSEFVDELDGPPTVAEAVEIVRWALPSNDESIESFDWPVTIRIQPSTLMVEASSRVGELNDSVFVSAAHDISLLAREHADVRGRQVSVDQLLASIAAAMRSTDDLFDGPAPPAQFRLKAEGRRRNHKLRPADVVAIPIGPNRYRFAVVLFEPISSWDTGFGLLAGEAERPAFSRRHAAPALPYAIFTDERSVASGRWIRAGTEPSLIQLFPRERIVYHPKQPYFADEDMGPYGLAEAVGGVLRKAGEAEAKSVGMLDGSYYSGGMSETVESWIAQLPS